MKFASAFAVLACTFVSQASTVPNVLSDIAKIHVDVANLDKQILEFPNSGGSITAALAIHTAAEGIIPDINIGTTDTNNVTPLPISNTDANSILSAFDTFRPVIISALSDIVAKKAAFVALPVGGLPALIKSDLTSLNTATQAFEAALIGRTPSFPADLLSTIHSWTQVVNAAFATAIAAYS